MIKKILISLLLTMYIFVGLSSVFGERDTNSAKIVLKEQIKKQIKDKNSGFDKLIEMKKNSPNSYKIALEDESLKENDNVKKAKTYLEGEGNLENINYKEALNIQKKLQKYDFSLHKKIIKKAIGDLEKDNKEDAKRLLEKADPRVVTKSLVETGKISEYKKSMKSCKFFILCSKVNSYTLAQQTFSKIIQDSSQKAKKECTNGDESCFIKKRNEIVKEQVNEIKETCKDKNTDFCKNLKKEFDYLENKNKLIQTNFLYDVMDFLARPDYNAIKAAKLFGFEANLDNVPTFLRDNFPSQICIAKIEGYLDKEIPNSGGITKYGCSEKKSPYYDYDRKRILNGETANCLEILADLRAQRTKITPDGRTSISYSYYLKGPRSGKIKYLLAISYKEEGRIKKIPILEPKTLNNGSVAKGFEQISIKLNNSKEIRENSFQIGLVAVYEKNRKPYITLTYPIILINLGDYYYETSSGGNSKGNFQAREQLKQQNSINSEDLLNLFN